MDKYIQNKGKQIVEKIIKEENAKFFAWLFGQEVNQSRRELARWAFENDYK